MGYSAVMKKVWAEQREALMEARAKSEAYNSPLRAERIGAKAKERWADPEYAAKMKVALKTAMQDFESKRFVPVIVDGIEYKSVALAARMTGRKYNEIRRLAKAQGVSK